ncbi:MAG: ion channel [Eubacteriales bacterium]|nr:ion channel [Eubacteriales bacterium]
MKKLKLLRGVLRRTHADSIILSFLIFVLVCGLVVLIVEPNITTYFDALWYIYSVTFTVGLGDVVVSTVVGKVCSLLISVYALFVTAVATGVVVSFYNKCVEEQYRETTEAVLDKLSRLPELSKEELEAISNKVKKIKQ